MEMGDQEEQTRNTINDMVAKILWLSGSAIFLILGTLHLYYTFFTNKFNRKK